MSIHFVSLVEKAANQVITKALNVPQLDAQMTLWNTLSRLGITKENVDSHSLISDGFCKEGDTRFVFCEGPSPMLTVPWFRKVWSILSENATTGEKTNEVSGFTRVIDALTANRPVSQWKDRELVEAYGVDASNEVIDELKKRAQGKTIVAFDSPEAGRINVDVTFDLLRESRRRKLPDYYPSGETIYKLYTVGDFPNSIYEESPLVPGNLLFRGYCDKCETNFSEVSKEARQFLRVIVDEGQAPKLSDRMSILGLIVAAKSGIEELRKLFPSVSIRFDELQRKDELPSLKADSADPAKSKVSDPFGNKRF